ncbi:hypothetical protein JHK84_033953 [Glycine max]|nr:hypothetical protein JHK84_033953 [Glycine max]
MRLKHVKSVESLRGHPIKLERYVKSVEESIVECGKEKRCLILRLRGLQLEAVGAAKTREDAGPAERRPSNMSWWPSDFVEKFESVSLSSQDETLNNKESPRHSNRDVMSPQKASQILWRTGMLSEPIPNGFYSVILVSDFYKRSNVESPAKAALEESSHMFENRGVQMLGQIRHGSCRPRAILFKVLADTVGLESRLMMGFPNDGAAECVDSYKHMSVIVVLNSVELLVDLMRFPGQLLPRSTKSILMTHISAAGESDSAENDSCDSPLEPNSPLYGVSESVEKEENLQFHRRFEVSSNVSGLPLRNMMLRSNTSLDRNWSFSHSEPNIATAFGRRSRRKVIAEQRTASSSPEHPSLRAHGRSKLSGDRTSFRDFADDQSTLRSSYKSDGASSSEARRIRRRSISITPEIGDDIARAVRAMNKTLKQKRLPREQGGDSSLSHSPIDRTSSLDLQKNVSNFHLDGHHERSPLYLLHRDPVTSQKAMSLPSSPHDYRVQASERSEASEYTTNDELESTWNKILESPMFSNRPLLPYEEWNIDFTELNVGTRVGIGFFGEVFRGIWNGTDVAIKVFLEQDLTAENMEDFCNEISILSRLRHPNVILFLGACTKPPRLSMVTEYMEMGSLFYLIHVSGQKKKLSWRRRLKMLRDICRGLMHIHRMKIIHRDVKSANCLVDKHWIVKICDFGLSRIITESPMRDSSSAGTPEWMAPELIRNEPFSEKCDIFSLGVIMWELCTLNRPWEGVPPERVVYTVANEGARLDIPEGPLGRLISECWAEPHERPSCEEILSRLVDIEYSMC